METFKKLVSSWVVVIISLVIFFPIGFVFLYMKLFLNSGKLKANKVFLWILTVFCCLMVAAGINVIIENGKAEIIDIVLAILFLVGTLIAAKKALTTGKEYEYYQKYVDHIGVRGKVSLKELAEETGNSMETVIKDVSKVIQYNMMEGYINKENEFIQPDYIEYSDSWIEEETPVKPPKVYSVKCKNCGATNRYIEEKENQCEYCGSFLEKERIES